MRTPKYGTGDRLRYRSDSNMDPDILTVVAVVVVSKIDGTGAVEYQCRSQKTRGLVQLFEEELELVFPAAESIPVLDMQGVDMKKDVMGTGKIVLPVDPEKPANVFTFHSKKTDETTELEKGDDGHAKFDYE